MPATGRSFAISATPQDLAVAPGARARTSVTITNSTGLHLDGGRAVIVPKDGTPKEWLSFVDEAGKPLANQQPEAAYAANESRTYVLQVAAPADAAPGTYGARVEAVSVRQPNDVFEIGPDLSIAVRAAAVADDGGGKRGWIAIAAVAAVIVVGGAVAVILALRSRVPEVPVPKLVGLPFNEAVRGLETAGLRLGPIETKQVADGAADVVLEQDPKDGAVEAATPISLTLSAKPPPATTVQVPKVVGRSQAEAIAVLTAAQLRPQVRLVDTNKVADGIVLEQVPLEATPTPAGSVVNLVVERQRFVHLPDDRRSAILKQVEVMRANPQLQLKSVDAVRAPAHVEPAPAPAPAHLDATRVPAASDQQRVRNLETVKPR